jgi:hypothetical protein
MNRDDFERAALALVRARGRAHGAELIDLAMHHGFCSTAETYAEQWIEAAILRGEIKPLHAEPAHSQRAFASLGGMAARQWSVRGPGTALGWYYGDTEHRTPDERLRRQHLARLRTQCDWCATGACWTHKKGLG